MEFSYRRYPAFHPLTKERGFIFRPIIPVDVGYQNRWISSISEGEVAFIDALVDSGADHNFAPLEIAELLDIDFGAARPHRIVSIMGERTDTLFAPVSLNIGGRIFDALMGFGKEVESVVLGNVGFFDQWKAKLDYPKDIETQMK